MTGPIAPKPTHLGPAYGAQFGDESIVRAYRFRPPYPDEVFAILGGLVPEVSRAILDAGCGCGDLTLGMLGTVGDVERIDAVDLSAAMIAEGQRRHGGDDPRLRWLVGPMESVGLEPPHGLVTAGESLHWMDWAVVLPRIRETLVSGGVLAIVGREQLPTVWTDAHLPIINRYSTNRDYRPYNLVDELTSRGLFRVLGRQATRPVRHAQSIDDYIESYHSRNGLSRDRMSSEAAEAFDRETRELLASLGFHERVPFEVQGTVAWGEPAPELSTPGVD